MSDLIVQIFARVGGTEAPLLLETPIVRRGSDATLGFCPEPWEQWR